MMRTATVTIQGIPRFHFKVRVLTTPSKTSDGHQHVIKSAIVFTRAFERSRQGFEDYQCLVSLLRYRQWIDSQDRSHDDTRRSHKQPEFQKLNLHS